MTSERRPPRAALLLALLAGCAANEAPSEGGFLSGVGNLGSGGYDRRIAEREARNESLSAEEARVAGEAAALREEIAANEARLDALRARIRRQLLEIESLEGGLAAQRRAEAGQFLDATAPARRAAAAPTDDAARLASLSKAIEDAETLAGQLAELGAL